MKKIVAVVSLIMGIAIVLLSVALFKVDATLPVHFILYKSFLVLLFGFFVSVNALLDVAEGIIKRRRGVI